MNRGQSCLLSVAILLFLSLSTSLAFTNYRKAEKTAVLLSPEFVLGPGSVENRYYFDIDFPRGHIFIKSFNAEVVDADGNSIPLHETYLHHWIIAKFYQRKGSDSRADRLMGRNDGLCQTSLGQYFGLGSETRKTKTYIPDPFGIEIGNPKVIPEGYEEKWMLNVHAIDTRGVEDRLGCTECRCNLYNVTVDEYGRPIRPDYRGGLLCCSDHAQCKVKHGFQGTRRNLYLRYTIKWVDSDDSLVPVNIYILDVTDSPVYDTATQQIKHHCAIEYEVESCSGSSAINGECIDNKKVSLTMPKGGYVVYGAAHQHTGGTGSALYGEDGRVICASIPKYGEGNEAGNEEGYIVGMSTCYPKPGSMKIADGETLVLESNYSSSIYHSGVMGLFYLLVADQIPEPAISLRTLTHAQETMNVSTMVLVAALVGLALTIVVVLRSRQENKGGEGYHVVN
ncbi:hypothetical protein ACFE04_018822 [Oxalis oulophora]